VATPDSASKSEAQQRADDIRVFGRELARLEESGVVSLAPEQTEGIARYHRELLAAYARDYDIDRDAGAKQLSMGMRIASFLGALALAASVFFLFYQFWGKFSTAAQVVVLVLASFGSFLFTFVVDRRDATGYFTKLAALVAFACFVINITMLGRIFDITPSDKALLPWAAIALLLAYTFDLRLLLAAGILCLVAFLSSRAGTWGGVYWLHFGERPENFIPAAILIFCVPQLIRHDRFAGFAKVYRVFGLLTLLLPVLVLAHWGEGSYLAMDARFVEGIYQTLGFLLSAGAMWLGMRRHWAEVVNTGLTLFVIFLYTKFYDWWWDWMPKYLFFLLMGLSAILLLLVLRRVRASGYLTGGPA
jgi:uncharacterized membrane protein